MKKSVLNKQGNFGVKILWRYTDMAFYFDSPCIPFLRFYCKYLRTGTSYR